MKLEKAIEIKERNRHIGILCPTPEEFEADDMSIEALKRCRVIKQESVLKPFSLLPGETEE